jgi:hypothetical protein
MKEFTVPTGYKVVWVTVSVLGRRERPLVIAENRTLFLDRSAHSSVTITTELEPKIAGDRGSF